MKNFALIGSAGYIAPRHLQAIKDTGNRLVAALDLHDSVGILDSYFPDAQFFTEFERFDRHVELLRRKGDAIDYVSIASPNYLHDAHCRFALRVGAAAICEKPLVINPWNVDGLAAIEQETGGRIFTILQLRLHPSVVALRHRVRQAIAEDPSRRFDVRLNYVTSRGAWYFASWKGDERKSGGIVTNIGIHFFDMLLWIFGSAQGQEVEFMNERAAAGRLKLANADVRWFLSVSADDLPTAIAQAGQRTFRSITVDGEEAEFSNGFTDLHTESYRQILAGKGFGLEDARRSIELVHHIRVGDAEERPEASDSAAVRLSSIA
jgi:UDP-N-acetyl-2-amino-2-deoxyglucuronate dehydrogenase